MESIGLNFHLVGRSDDAASDGFRALFDNFFASHRPMFSLSEKVWNPPSDLYETAESVVIKMEIAGVKLDHLDIIAKFEENFLIIRGCRRENAKIKKEYYHLMEIRYGRFERAFPMPVLVHQEDIRAQYANGFLIVTIPKRTDAPRDIPIKVIDE